MEFLIVWAVAASTASLMLHLLLPHREVTDASGNKVPVTDLVYWMRLQEKINEKQLKVNDVVLKQLDLI